MTLVLELEPEIEKTAIEQATEEGLPLEKYAEIVFKQAINQRQKLKHTEEKSFREILAPIHKEFEESGMSEEELTGFLEELREQVWQEKQQTK